MLLLELRHSSGSAHLTDKTLTYRGAAGGGLQRAAENSGEERTQKMLARRNTTHDETRCVRERRAFAVLFLVSWKLFSENILDIVH